MLKRSLSASVMERFEGACAWLANLFLFAIMLIIVVDVTLRYLFNSPLQWAFDAISMYLMVGVFFFSLSDTFAGNGHVNVDLLYQRAPERVRRFVDYVTWALTFIVFAGIAYRAWAAVWESFRSGEVIAGNIAWPVWITHLIVAIGASLLALRLVFMFSPASRPLPEYYAVDTERTDDSPGEAA